MKYGNNKINRLSALLLSVEYKQNEILPFY